MNLPKKLEARRTFIKKALNFFKYYPPLTSKDPKAMLLKTLVRIEKAVVSANSVDELEALSDEIYSTYYHSSNKHLCQMQVEDEKGRFVVYEPIKFSDTKNGEGVVAVIYDLVYVKGNNSD